jgi:pimeloyl-ACP methyl ester carboxylesterase
LPSSTVNVAVAILPIDKENRKAYKTVMTVHRTYGRPPFTAVVVHGGPGAPGEMASVARRLAPRCGVVEPWQTAVSVAGQVAELKADIASVTSEPVVLVGHSWGAWLCWLLAARHPGTCRRLILVGSAPFTEEAAAAILPTRLERLTQGERKVFTTALRRLRDDTPRQARDAFGDLARLCKKTDSCEMRPSAEDPVVTPDAGMFASVWPEAAAMRASGTLLRAGRSIRCPVTAIHGAEDPHPAAGVRDPLEEVIEDFEFVLMQRCGHTPWMERQAADLFFRHLTDRMA